MTILYHSKFAREYKRLPEKVKDLAEEREQIFRADPFDHRLKTHKLKGPLTGFWSFSINQKYRVIFDFFGKGKDTVCFYSVGAHDIYDV